MIKKLIDKEKGESPRATSSSVTASSMSICLIDSSLSISSSVNSLVSPTVFPFSNFNSEKSDPCSISTNSLSISDPPSVSNPSSFPAILDSCLFIYLQVLNLKTRSFHGSRETCLFVYLLSLLMNCWKSLTSRVYRGWIESSTIKIWCPQLFRCFKNKIFVLFCFL